VFRIKTATRGKNESSWWTSYCWECRNVCRRWLPRRLDAVR